MEELGVSPKYIIAMQGPFSYALNRAMFSEKQVDTIVMKNSGLVGGSDTKLQAAMDLGLHIILIDRPKVEVKGLVVTETDTAIEEVKKVF